jgi:hypothetical protein
MKIATIISICLLSGVAFATGSDDDRDPGQVQTQDQYQKQYQGQETAVSIENAAAGGQAINEGNDQRVEFNSNYESQAPDILLVPNNNTEKCLRVFGFSFSTSDGGGGIGFPWRSAACDFEQAADDAFAGGERDLGWFWKCQSKNLYKPFRSKGESKESAMTDCQNRMMKGVSQTQMIAKLRDNLSEMNILRERELQQYRQSRRRCEDTTAKLEENCTK